MTFVTCGQSQAKPLLSYVSGQLQIDPFPKNIKLFSYGADVNEDG